LEDYRIFKYQIFHKEVEDVIAGIKREKKMTPQMTLGKLIHQYLETGNKEVIFEGKKYFLHDKEIEALQPLYLALKNCTLELKFREQLTDDIMISGVADSVYGIIGNEVKTGKKFYGVDFYSNSVQWKLYSLCLNLRIFTYIHIEIAGTYPPHSLTIQDLELFPYPGMKDEIISDCHEFIDFCKFHNLIPYIT
jgi:hypothetical protein